MNLVSDAWGRRRDLQIPVMAFDCQSKYGGLIPVKTWNAVEYNHWEGHTRRMDAPTGDVVAEASAELLLLFDAILLRSMT